MAERSHVNLPPGVPPVFQVFVNGVPQEQGRDFRREGDELVFDRSLAREGSLSAWRWLSMLLGVAGTYRKNDNIDIVYTAGGRNVHLSGLAITPADVAPK
jgi:hypothetical protein